MRVDTGVDRFFVCRFFAAYFVWSCVGHVNDCTVEHCEIHDGPHAGMIVGGNDHLITNNVFSYIALEYVDMGAIYLNLGSQPFQRGTTIVSNFFHHLVCAIF